MSQPQIDATRMVLRTLRWLDDARRAAATQWQEWTGSNRPEHPRPPSDRREPPDLW